MYTKKKKRKREIVLLFSSINISPIGRKNLCVYCWRIERGGRGGFGGGDLYLCNGYDLNNVLVLMPC